MKVKDLIIRLEDFLPNDEIGVEIQDKRSRVWVEADINTIFVATHTSYPHRIFIGGYIHSEVEGIPPSVPEGSLPPDKARKKCICGKNPILHFNNCPLYLEKKNNL